MPHVLAAGPDFQNPLFLAVLVGWLMTVVLHEFGHGIVAHWGGDYTIGERGGLTLNPLQYIHPVFSIVMPAIFLMMGGVPLPGGATYIRTDLLRSKRWETAVALAGPAMNLLIFAAGAIALHPKVGWVPESGMFSEWSPAQQVVASITFLQIYAVLLSLLPVPPLDGFHAISPYLSKDVQERFAVPAYNYISLTILFMVLGTDPVRERFALVIYRIFKAVGYDPFAYDNIRMSINRTLFGG
ncbi:site-2 protease family protein [Humisphaera borealis]|uniref:Site-2 protease family protein n=1 Tax=Humisphaera borealis TaxID=2807512 RepID=A0A7M2X3K1_9BACT|nr:site-2 protease family protein [Humisphaera borealis]QOV92254.1 site-2 protease family protein [Humisphaera borealis]